ncbi:GerMN domain-containing protein [Leucobacter sp. W1478]|uniref:GerMN domain-containing protein n=1 Tax=Leucobacter sp. W1478 TaxID=3439065 RepID=UPI003F2C0827
MSRRQIHQGMRLRALATTLLVCVGLVGCQGIPSSGPVHEGLERLSQADQPVQFNPGGPAQGASQEDIVRGFVSAAASSADDYATAREFLAPEYSDDWDPSLGVLVDEGTQQYREAEENVGVLSLSAIASVDGRGSLQPVGPGAATEVRFEFAEIGGEWRITSAPAGIILDKSTFAAVWTPLQLYFLSADNRLVSDTRWFLNRATISTQVVGELLEGPTEQMIEVVRSAIPAGTVLAAGAVPVVDGTARIDLSAELLDADAATMELVKRQLGASLQSVPNVARFELLVNSSLIESGTVIAADTTSPTAENLYVAGLKDGEFGPISAGDVTVLPGIGARIAQLEPSAVTLAPDRGSAAVLHQGAVSWVSPDDQVVVDVRGDLIAPSLDRFGHVWTYSSAAPGEMLVTKPGERSTLLQMPWLGGRVPVAVRVAQGGNRIAVLVVDAASPDQSKVLVAGISRDESGVPVALTDIANTELWVPGTPVDLDWIDDERFAAVTRAGASGKVTQGVLGQFAVESGVVPGAVSLSGGGNRSLLRVLDDDGRLYAPQGSGWQRQLDGIALVAKVG